MKTNKNTVTSQVLRRSKTCLGAVVLALSFAASATFAQTTGYFLSVNNSPSDAGYVTADPTPPAEGYEAGTVVTLTAVPDGTNQFYGWTGATNTTANPITIVMDADKTLTADFNPPPPSNAQIIWQHAHGKLARWFVSGTALLSGQTYGSTGGKVVGFEEFNGDGDGDVVIQTDGGKLSVWMRTDETSQTVTIGTVNPSYRVVAVADFDRDGDNDILFQHASANLALWIMDGFTRQQTISLGRAGGGWRVATAYDADKDGDTDILLQHGSGRLALWEMDGTTRVKGTTLAAPGHGWRLAGVGDLNGDGNQDFLFQHPNGQTAVWNMEGTTKKSAKLLRGGKPIAPGWRVVGVK